MLSDAPSIGIGTLTARATTGMASTARARSKRRAAFIGNSGRATGVPVRFRLKNQPGVERTRSCQLSMSIGAYIVGMRGLACLTLAFMLATPVHALDPQKSITQFTHTAWSAKDGIPGPVRAIAQTRDGYLWLGTEAGLYRFDGLRFVPYEHSSPHPHGPAVLALLAARDGSLWMGFGSGGIGLLRDGQFTHFPPGEGVPAGGILSIVEDAAGSIWAAGQYGLASFQNGKWRRVGTEMGYAAPGAQSLLVDQAGTLWVATHGLNFGLG